MKYGAHHSRGLSSPRLESARRSVLVLGDCVSEFLRPISHPGQAETLVHFTGRARKQYAPEVYFLTPPGILDLIVTEERLLAKPTFGTDRRVVCLSESNISGVEALLSTGQFEGWGVVLRRDWVWRNGGGPIWYARHDVWQTVQDRGDQDLLRWMVRTSPQTSDWLHEREWRIPAADEYLDLSVDGVVALLVSDPEWQPFRPTSTVQWGDGQFAAVEITNHIASEVPRWYWDGQRIQVLEPVPFEEVLLGFVDF